MTKSQAYRAAQAKKNHVLQLKKQRPALSERELANLTGLSKASVHRTLTNVVQNERKEPAQTPEPSTVPSSSPPVQEPKEPLNFADTPTPIEDEKSLIDRGMSALKGMLGIADKDKKTAPPPLTEKLDSKRQAFVAHISPIVALGFMLATAAVWRRIGPEYAILAPDDETALRIVEPLVRIYARHQDYLAEINPDQMDLGACLFALFGYIQASLKLYQHMKEEKEAYESGYREYRSAAPTENGANGTSSRQPGRAGHAGANNNGYAGREAAGAGQSPANLTDKERKQYEALSLLTQRDYQSRLRRSGIIQ